ncbi:MAG TPA: hypothetical protein VL996_13180 [Methylocella sp.]|nr:hypothetical protein [Methylocella sp.]
MRVLNVELLEATAEEIRNLVQRAYSAGCARDREAAKREFQDRMERVDDVSVTAGGSGTCWDIGNGIDKRGITGAIKRLMRRDLAELKEMVRLGAGVPGDEQRIEMINALLARWHAIAPMIPLILDTVESETRH